MDIVRKKLIRSTSSRNTGASPDSSGVDEDEILDKYSCTPPSPRARTKLKKQKARREIYSLPAYSSLDEFKLSCNEPKTKFPNLKQQPRQRSIQSTHKRLNYKLSVLNGGRSSYPSSFDSSGGSSDEEEIVTYRSTINQDLKVNKQWIAK